MAKELGKLVVRVDMDGTGFQNGISNLNRQMKVAQSEFQKASAKIGDFGKTTDGLKLKANSLNEQIGIQRQRVQALTQAHAASVQAKGADAKETQNLAVRMNKAQAELYKMENSLKSVNKEIATKSSAWHRWGQSLENTGNKMQTVGHHAANVGRTMSMYVTAPLVAAGGASVKFAVDFESAFAGVRKTVDATEREFASMKQEIRDMAKTIPATTEEISKVAEVAGQLGIKKQDIMAFTKTMVKMGVATNMSSEDAATALARLANITQMPMKNIDRLGATVVHLGNNLAAMEDEIVEMGLRIAGAGHQVGMAEHQILGFAGALAAVGIKAEAGGTAISRVMLQMNTDVQEGGRKLELFAKVAGVTAQEFKQHFQKDAAGAIVDFIEGLGKMKENGENVVPVLKELGLNEIRVRDALLRASGAGDLFRESLELGSKAWKENSALNKEAAERYKTTASQMKILWNRIKDVGLTLGEALIPSLIKVMDYIKPFIDQIAGLAKQFSELPPGVQTAAFAFVALVAAMGPILMMVGDIVAAVGGMISIFGMASTAMAGAGGAAGVFSGALAAITGPVGWVTAAVVAAVAAGVALWANWDKLEKKLGPLGTALVALATGPVGAVVLAIKTAKKVFSDAIPEVDRFGDRVSKSTKKALGGYFKLEEEASASLKRLYWSGDKVTKDTAEKVSENFSAMGDKIIKGIDKKQQEAEQILGSWFKAENVLPDKREQEIITKLNTHYDKQRKEVEQGEKRVQEILETASKEKRSISEKEYKEIEKYMYNFRSAAVENLTKSEQEQKVIWERIRNQNTAISAREAVDIVKQNNKQTEKVIKNAEKVRDEKIDLATKLRDELGLISDDEAKNMIDNANLQYDETVKKAKDKRRDVVEEAKKQAKEHVNEVDWETAEILSNWEVFWNDMDEKWKAGEKWWDDFWTKLGDRLAEWWDQEVQDFFNLWDTVKEKWSGVEEWWDTFWTGLKEKLSTKWEEMKTDAGVKWDGIKEKIKEKAMEIALWPVQKFEELKAKASTKWEQIKSDASTKWNSMKTRIIEIADEIKRKPGEKFNQLKNDAIKKFEELRGKASSKWQSIKTTVTEKVEGMKKSVREKMENVRKTVVEKWEKAQGYLKKVSLRQIGKDIINGLIGGITSRAQSLYDKAESIAKRIKRTFERVLDIKSPSRVMMRIGEYVGDGMAIGMGSRVPRITRQAELMANAAIPGVGRSGAPQLAQARGGSITNNRNITIHVSGATNPTATGREVLRQLAIYESLAE